MLEGNRIKDEGNFILDNKLNIDTIMDFKTAEIGSCISTSKVDGTEIRTALVEGFSCCVKIFDLPSELEESLEKQESINKEISLLMTAKKCKQVVRYIHHEKFGQTIRLYTELLPENLGNLIVKRKKTMNYFENSQIMTIFYQVLKGLNFLHKSSIVHRDIKPDNILLEIDLWNKISRVKIADFSCSQILIRGRASTQLKGTLGYQAPEMIPVANQKPNHYSSSVDSPSFFLIYYLNY